MMSCLLDYFLVYTGPEVSPERSKTTRAHLVSSLTVKGLFGRLHGDIKKGFMCAEVTRASNLLEYSNYTAAKDIGCIRTEGKDYNIDENDVVLIKWK